MIVIENAMKEGSQGEGSRPDTPASIRQSEVIANMQAAESGASSQEEEREEENQEDLELIRAHFEEAGKKGEELEDLLPRVERHTAKYDFAGTTDIELDFKKGCVVKVIERADNGWWKGVFAGHAGWFPESYVDPTPLPAATVRERSKVKAKEARGRAQSADSVTEVERPKNMDETMADAGKCFGPCMSS